MQKRIMRSLLSMSLALVLMSFAGAGAYASSYGDYSSSDSPEYLYYIEETGSNFLPGGESDIFFNL